MTTLQFPTMASEMSKLPPQFRNVLQRFLSEPSTVRVTPRAMERFVRFVEETQEYGVFMALARVEDHTIRVTLAKVLGTRVGAELEQVQIE